MIVLFLYRTETTWPGLLIVLCGLPVYAAWRRFGGACAGVAAELASAGGAEPGRERGGEDHAA